MNGLWHFNFYPKWYSAFVLFVLFLRFSITLPHLSQRTTVEPRFNEPLFNEVLDITNDILCPGQSHSKMYGIEPRYNEFFDITNIIRKPKRKIYLDITNYSVNTRQKINAEYINSQQILVILMAKRQQPFSQRLIICHRHWHYSISTSINFCSIFFEFRKCWAVQRNNTETRFLLCVDNFLYNLYVVTFLNRYSESVVLLQTKPARLLKSENNWYWKPPCFMNCISKRGTSGWRKLHWIAWQKSPVLQINY